VVTSGLGQHITTLREFDRLGEPISLQREIGQVVGRAQGRLTEIVVEREGHRAFAKCPGFLWPTLADPYIGQRVERHADGRPVLPWLGDRERGISGFERVVNVAGEAEQQRQFGQDRRAGVVGVREPGHRPPQDLDRLLESVLPVQGISDRDHRSGRRLRVAELLVDLDRLLEPGHGLGKVRADKGSAAGLLQQRGA
jgi:hypothetical protein